MTVGQISDPEAIRAAASECDQMGQPAFLAKYGFRMTRYVAVVDGKRYPGKALVAAAHGYEFPDEGPLVYGQLSGGRGGANRVLTRLGFEVIDTRQEELSSTDGPRVWIEVTRTKRPDRVEGPHRLGAALWSPKTDATGGDLYRDMRAAQVDDWVLHLTNAKAIVGRSRIAGPVEDLPHPPPDTVWSDRDCQRVPLKDYEEFDPPLPRETFLNTSPFSTALKQLKDQGIRNVFFNKNLQLAQGHYFTFVPKPVLNILCGAYGSIAEEELIPGCQGDGGEIPKMSFLDVPQELVDWTHLTPAALTELLELLEEKKQIILYGPPGSGKTFVADALARHLTENAIDPDVGDLNSRYELVQFHQSYGYEDFIQGIRPSTDGKSLSYVVQDGILKLLRDRADEDPAGVPYVMLIDEINRGNLSRIFGELLLLLEYRGDEKQVRLPYDEPDEPRFTLPDNLYFIGTMNTADRSLAQIDYALRRRFFFSRLRPVVDGKAPVLEAWLKAQEPPIPASTREEILTLFVALNDAVTRERGEDFQVGHSYFMTPTVTTAEGRDRIWRTSIEPLLDEYFHDRRNRAKLIDELRPDALLASVSGAGVGATEEVGSDADEE